MNPLRSSNTTGDYIVPESMSKRLLDIIVSLGVLFFVGPLIVVLILLIRLETRGPGIFQQQRVGQGGRLFRCNKLRTMVADTPNVPTHLASSSQITRLGRFLRSTKLDELPQLWNVVRGDMSLVGPRPCLPTQGELINERSSRGIFELKPGVTGLAQIRGIDMSVPLRLAEVDQEYLQHRNFLYDIRILLRTFTATSARGDRVKS